MASRIKTSNGAVVRGRGRRIATGPAPQPNENQPKIGDPVIKQLENAGNDTPSICIENYFEEVSDMAKRLDIKLDIQTLYPERDPCKSNHFDLSEKDPQLFNYNLGAIHKNVHDLYVKSIPYFDGCSIYFRKAMQHHAATYNLGSLDWVRVQDQT